MTRTRRPWWMGGLLAWAAACGGPDEIPRNPTWADVEPILRGQCTHCHGSTAAQTGASAGATYRFDFYDMSPQVCDEAAFAMPAGALAAASAGLIVDAVTAGPGATRGRMPPAPAEPLSDHDREVLTRWAAHSPPLRGAPLRENRRPQIQLRNLPKTASGRLAFTVVVDDPDGEPVVGVLHLGPLTYKMDRAGSFAVDLDISAWPSGPVASRATLCDGWSSFTYDLPAVLVVR